MSDDVRDEPSLSSGFRRAVVIVSGRTTSRWSLRSTRRAAVACDRRRCGRAGVAGVSARAPGGGTGDGEAGWRQRRACGARPRSSSSTSTPSTRSRCSANRSFPARAPPRCPSSSIGCSPSNRPTRRSASSSPSAPSSARRATRTASRGSRSRRRRRPRSSPGCPTRRPARRPAAPSRSSRACVAETYFATEAGLKELGWNRSVMFASPIACG